MFSKYDAMTRKELKAETTKRFGTNTGLKPGLLVNRNQPAYKYRLVLIQDDLQKGIDPYIGTSLYHNNSFPYAEEVVQTSLQSVPSPEPNLAS